jgi:hypothetical protein
MDRQADRPPKVQVATHLMPRGREHSERRERRDSNWKGVPEPGAKAYPARTEEALRWHLAWRGTISVYELRLVNTLDPRRRMLGLAVLAANYAGAL